tara:strand:- start:102 stop:923 length:822 start_codon:yes stop_codon:yes gene_type:complete
MHTLNVEYKKGDIVKFNKDTKQSRLWKIGLIQDDDNIALITEDVDDIPENIEILEKKENSVIVHATKKDIYFDLSPGYINGSPAYAPNSPLYSPGTDSTYIPHGSPPPWDPDSPPYSAELGRQMTKEEYDAAYNNMPRTPSTSPQYAIGSPPYVPRSPSTSPQGVNTSSSVSTTSSTIPPPPPGSPPSNSAGISINEDYTPGTPIMITPMVPTQKLSEIKQEDMSSSNLEKKGVTYSTILENNEFKRETPLLTTIEDNKKKEEQEEKLKSVNL